MDPAEAGRIAYRELTRELRRALLRKLAATLREMGLDETADDGAKVSMMLNVIVTARPELLREARKAAQAAHLIIGEAVEEVPPELQSETPLKTSRLGAYGAIPENLNAWEQDFVRLLDTDGQGIVRWWLRNEPRKDWSVQAHFAALFRLF